MKKYGVVALVAVSLLVSSCGRKVEVASHAEEQAGAKAPELVNTPPAGIAAAQSTDPIATRCAITTYDRHQVSFEEVEFALTDKTRWDLMKRLDSARLNFVPVCLDATDTTAWYTNKLILDDISTGRQVFMNAQLSNDPASLNLTLIYQNKQLLPLAGSILVGRNQSSVQASTNYVYEIRCNLTVAECSQR